MIFLSRFIYFTLNEINYLAREYREDFERATFQVKRVYKTFHIPPVDQ